MIQTGPERFGGFPGTHAFSIEGEGVTLRCFGCAHVSDPGHPYLRTLETAWDLFVAETAGRPRVAMVEGRLRALRPTREQAVTQSGGEGGLLTFLAARDGVAVECPEPSWERLFAAQRERFDERDLCHAYYLRGLVMWHRLRDRQPLDQYVASSQPLARMGCPLSREETDRRHLELFGEPLDRLDEGRLLALTDPIGDGIANRIMASDAEIRDAFVTAEIVRRWREGRSVFVVFGVVHVMVQEPGLRAALEPLPG